MREIKFRAWDKEQKDLFEVVAINYKKKRVYSSWNDLDGKNLYAEFDQAVLMQCTGSKDKNGVEIYEGDIVRGRIYHMFYEDNVVFQIGWIDEENGYGLHWFPKEVEVIGNVYENPELWEVQS